MSMHLPAGLISKVSLVQRLGSWWTVGVILHSSPLSCGSLLPQERISYENMPVGVVRRDRVMYLQGCKGACKALALRVSSYLNHSVFFIQR